MSELTRYGLRFRIYLTSAKINLDFLEQLGLC